METHKSERRMSEDVTVRQVCVFCFIVVGIIVILYMASSFSQKYTDVVDCNEILSCDKHLCFAEKFGGESSNESAYREIFRQCESNQVL